MFFENSELSSMIKLLEEDYNTNLKFKEIIDKVRVIESIYKGLNKKDIPKIKQTLEFIKEHSTEKVLNSIKFGNITYDVEDFLSIDFDKIVEDESIKLVGISFVNEKLVRKLNLHGKNLIECLKIVYQHNELELFNTLLFSCLSVYLIINTDNFILQNISKTLSDILERYKIIVLEVLETHCI